MRTEHIQMELLLTTASPHMLQAGPPRCRHEQRHCRGSRPTSATAPGSCSLEPAESLSERATSLLAAGVQERAL